MCRSSRAVVLLCLFLSSVQNAICIASDCVSGLPQSVDELLSLVKGSSLPDLTHLNGQVRLFPNVTFNCSGSIVGWSMVTGITSMTGGRPMIHTWNSSDGQTFEREAGRSRLRPCLKKVISSNDQLYLHENITEIPLEFQYGDILGMLLRSEDNVAFQPYFIAKDTFIAHYRDSNSAKLIEDLQDGFEQDDMMPLLFLHICSKDEAKYEECMEKYSRPPSTCIESPSSTPSSTPSSSTNGNDGVSNTVLIISVGVALCLLLLIVTMVLVLTLLCVVMSRRKRRKRREHKRNGVAIVTENTDVIGEAQPYAEPCLRPSPQPSSRAHTPLPPPPTHPPPPPGLSVQPTYAVLDGPSPSPPPPYILDLELANRPPRLNSLPSPEYESIDKKTFLQRQDATETNGEAAGYAVPRVLNDNN